MDRPEQGGPAFPGEVEEEIRHSNGLLPDEINVIRRPVSGMTLLEWYAGQALMGICSSGPAFPVTHDRIAGDAYRLGIAAEACKLAAALVSEVRRAR